MKIKTNEASGVVLDWLVARIEGDELPKSGGKGLDYSSDWSQGGPIIEREEIGTKRRAPCMKGEEWEAMGSITAKGAGYRYAVGPTPLIAVMRCYVASKLGDDVVIPNELIGE